MRLPEVSGNSRPCIAIVHTDISPNPTPDDADTILQAQFISRTLNELGYHAPLLPFRPKTLQRSLQQCNAIAVFNLVEAVGGDDERATEGPLFFEKIGMPYTGNKASTMQALENKPVVKRRLQQHDLPTPAFPEDGGQGKQWILKSETFHCSRGMDHRNVSSDIDALNELARECAARYSGAWFLEEYIPGREINMALLDNGDGTATVLPASEIRFLGKEPHIVDYDCKWNEESESYNSAVANMEFTTDDQPMLDQLAYLSQQCWRHFGLSGYARVDFRIDNQGRPFILEINANPCLSDDAGFMRAISTASMTPADAISRIITPVLHQKTHEARRA